jgi:hypothetical protein
MILQRPNRSVHPHDVSLALDFQTAPKQATHFNFHVLGRGGDDLWKLFVDFKATPKQATHFYFHVLGRCGNDLGKLFVTMRVFGRCGDNLWKFFCFHSLIEVYTILSHLPILKVVYKLIAKLSAKLFLHLTILPLFSPTGPGTQTRRWYTTIISAKSHDPPFAPNNRVSIGAFIAEFGVTIHRQFAL